MNFDHQKYKAYTWKNLMVLHWIINPGLAVNELILGQRIPKLSLEYVSSEKSRAERIIIPCPNCQSMHDSRIWSTENGTAFKNWFGLYCPACGAIIPCLCNITSLLILAITSPVWFWFYKPLKKSWLAKQPSRFEHIDANKITNPFEGRAWLGQGINFGLIMFALNDLIIPICSGKEIGALKILIGIPVWLLAGLLFGYTMKLFMGKKGQKERK